MIAGRTIVCALAMGDGTVGEGRADEVEVGDIGVVVFVRKARPVHDDNEGGKGQRGYAQ